MGIPTERIKPTLLGGVWRRSEVVGTYRSIDPATGEEFGPLFPISSSAAIDEAIDHTCSGPALGEQRAAVLDAYATKIEAASIDLAAIAARETGLPAEDRFVRVEIPRTVDQLRQAARSARADDWCLPTIDTKHDIRSCLGPIGTVAIFGPANFPFAYNAIAGGDFASAFAAGNAILARAHPSHPQTTKALAELLIDCWNLRSPPPFQLLFGFSNDDGVKLVASPRIAAVGFTGSRAGGLALKAASDRVGTPFYGEMSSVNPVFIPRSALLERSDAIADEYLASVLLAGGQMCTNPGIVFLEESLEAERFISRVVAGFEAVPPPVLLNEPILRSLEKNVALVEAAGAKRLCGGTRGDGPGFRFAPTLLHITGQQFIENAMTFQTEMFGPAALIVVCKQLGRDGFVVIAGSHLEGALCGSIYTDTRYPADWALADNLRRRCGRLLTDKMPTGVTVSPAMNHGGPYPSTGHAGFTAVGFPASIRRFAKLNCYDHVRHDLLPTVLRDENPTGAWRNVDGEWTLAPIE